MTDALTARDRQAYATGEWMGEPPSDVRRILDLLAPLCSPDRDTTLFTTVEGPPKSKARPRPNPRGGVWSPSKADEDALALRLKGVARGEVFTGNVALAAVFFRPNFQRVDTDNMLKLVLDAGTTAGLWLDDCQVTAVLGVVELDRDRPRTLIGLGEHSSTLDRRRPQATCRRCGRLFALDHWGRGQVFCSPSCRGESWRQAKVHPGQGRGLKGQPPATCRDCGRPLSKRSYIRCRSCWTKARSAGIS